MRYVLQISISLLFIFVVNVHAQKVVFVAGIVVDSKGRPVVGAKVSYDAPDHHTPNCALCIIVANFTKKTMRDGVFFIEEEIGVWAEKGDKEIKVFIKKLAPKHIWSPVMYVRHYGEKFSEFAGIVRKIPKSGEINIGETSKYLWYRTISLNPLKLFGKEIDIEKVEPILINIKYKGVYFVKDEVVSKMAINKKANRVEFALPQGTWELFLRTKDKKIAGKAIAVMGDEVEIFYRDVERKIKIE